MTTQPLTLTLLTIGGIALSGWLTEDKLPTWAKSLIAAISVFLAALVYAAITGQFTGNFMVTFAAISAIIGWLMVGPLEPVHSWMTSAWTGPFAMLAEALIPVPVEEPPTIQGNSVTPRPIPKLPLPTTPDMVARPSLLSNDPTWRPTTAAPLQVPSVDPGHVAGPVPPTNSAQATTGPLPASPPQPSQGANGSQGNAQTPGLDQGGQSAPPSSYGNP